MKYEKSVERQTKNTIEYYKNLDNIEEAPIDILRAMYKDLLQNSIPKKKIEDKIKDIEKLRLNKKDYYKNDYFINCEIRLLQELLEDK